MGEAGVSTGQDALPPPQGGREQGGASSGSATQSIVKASIIKADLVDQRRGRLAVGGDLRDWQRIGVELAITGDRRVDGDAGAHRIFVVLVGIHLLRLFTGQPL